MHRLQRIVLLATASFSGAVLAEPPVEVLALFKDRVLVRAADGQHLLERGETSPGGVTLLAADARGARVRYRGKVYDLTLSDRVAGAFAAAERQRVDISPDAQGQYRVRGTINGRFVDFLVDTGASVVAMSRAQAEALGLDVERGQRGTVQTAQGTVGSSFVTLDRVIVGGVTAHNVQAAVIDGRYPVDVLLGMSFLRQVAMEERDGVLSLIQR